jgi:copper transport protein
MLTEPAAAGDNALSHMRRGIAAEIVIILAVLGPVSVWRFTPPPRALVTEQSAPDIRTSQQQSAGGPYAILQQGWRDRRAHRDPER